VTHYNDDNGGLTHFISAPNILLPNTPTLQQPNIQYLLALTHTCLIDFNVLGGNFLAGMYVRSWVLGKSMLKLYTKLTASTYSHIHTSSSSPLRPTRYRILALRFPHFLATISGEVAPLSRSQVITRNDSIPSVENQRLAEFDYAAAVSLQVCVM
jgi:hypothetical protein